MDNLGKYQILGKIGKGGFGDVYKGYDPYIKRHVAVKTCNTDEKEIRDRFFQEAEIAGNLHHRNITTVYDFGVENGLPFLIQEYLSGEDLDLKIKRRETIPYAEKLHYLIQIARGLAYAHEQGVIHRDIKPANVRILEDGTAKIMDFGIAKLAQQESGLTQTGMTLGTAAYLAPEQIKGEPVSHSTDIFSFGVLAYELLTFQRPFAGEQISNVLYQILNTEPRAIVELWPPAPADIRELIKHCLSKRPEGRYPDGNGLRRALEMIQASGREERSGKTALLPNTIQPTPAPPVRPEPSTPQPTAYARDSVAPGPNPLEEATRTLDSVELSSSQLDLEQRPTLPMQPPTVAAQSPSSVSGPMLQKKKSPLSLGTLLGLLLIGIVALGAGWWFGRSADSSASSPPATQTAQTATAQSGPAGGAQGEATQGSGSEPETGTSDLSLAGEVSEDPNALPTEEIPPPIAEPPPPEAPPPPPADGTLVIPAAGWTDSMTVRFASGKTYPLMRLWEITLPPGTYQATFQVEEGLYQAEETISLQVRSEGRTSVDIPIPRPGAISVRARPGRPQGSVVLVASAERIDLGQSPVASVLLAPGSYQVEILGSGDQKLTGQVLISSAQEKVLTFDLMESSLREGTKDLD